MPVSRIIAQISFMAILAVGGCARANRWACRVEQWGTMREVMRDGKSDARIALSEFVGRPEKFAIGALESLNGEILIVSGVCWTSRVTADRTLATTSVAGTQKAALLTAADVSLWNNIAIPNDIAANDVEPFIEQAARISGLDIYRPFPFIVRTRLSKLKGHVVSGACAWLTPDADLKPETRPLRIVRDECDGILLGFFARDSAGEMTHHGSSTHMHVLIRESPPIVAHVDHVTLRGGGRLQLPAPDWPPSPTAGSGKASGR